MPRPWLFAAAVLTLVLLADTTWADVPVPGWKKIEHTIEITGHERAPAGTTFVVAPLHLGHGSDVLGPGVSFVLRGKYANPNLYALPPGRSVAEEPDAKQLEESDAPRAEHPFAAWDTIRSMSPATRVHSVYEVVAIEGRKVEVRHLSTTFYDARGGEVTTHGLGTAAGWNWPPLLLSVAGLAGLVALGFWWRRRSVSEAEVSR